MKLGDSYSMLGKILLILPYSEYKFKARVKFFDS